ncbi:PAS domain-containing protein [Hyphomicrobium sp.]|uniref:PAS domain-containing protein n=1 Tax=Hyphomicrobium sp. TaxID=82 RepID=UPI002D7752B4|nr:PAS domain-containing protein [Hyphomicrobium sp.]HET6389800.1 PAS domain-containing protein [Hyphomicrobium sp.]
MKDWFSYAPKPDVSVSDSPRLMTIAALLIAAGIFVVDIYTPLGIAAAALYSVVVVLAARLTERQGLLAIGFGCMALTVLAYAIQHGSQHELGPLMRCVGSLCAILLTTLIALKTQEAAKTSREQAGLLELTHDGVFVRKIDDCITFWNFGATQLYGWTKEDALGQASENLLHTIYPIPLADLTAELYRTGRWEGEIVRTHKDGHQIEISSRWSLQRDNKSRPVAILETNNDISERKRIEEERRQQELELRLFIDTIPTLGWICRPDGSAEYLNKRWLDYTGLALADAQGWSWKCVFHPDDLERMLEHYQQCLQTGELFEDEARMRRFDGVYRWMLFRAQARRDAQGQIIKWYGTNTDIEELKSAELAVLRSQAYLDDAQRLSHTGSFAWKPTTNEMIWSKEAYQILGVDLSAAPTIGLMFDQVHEDDREFVKQQIKRAVNGEREFDFETRLLTSHDKALRHLHIRACRVAYGSGEEEIVGALMDVTGTRHAQAALQSAQADLAHAARVATLGEISASIAHEVNQPLAAIVTLGQAGQRWLKREKPDMEEALSSLSGIVSEANRAAEVIQRVRQFAKKAKPDVVKLDINELVRDVARLVRHEALTNHVTLRMVLGEGIPMVTGDRIQLQQVIVNLMMNGLQAMAKTHERPRILTAQTASQSGTVLVVVEDCGCGIGSKPAEELFTAFYTTKENGMGMGLSICRSIIEAHGGRIWAAPNAGHGMSFQFTVPVDDQASSEATACSPAST